MLRSLLVLLLGLAAVPCVGLASPVVPIDLGPGVSATLSADGTLAVRHVAGRDTLSILELQWPLITTGRRGEELVTFRAPSREGAAAGRRGFGSRADDDGDGRADEDRLDGRDNDGDGAIDEDFAAIGHQMLVWQGNAGPVSHHLEISHWTYPALTTLLAVNAEHADRGVSEPLRLSVPAAAVWRPADELVPGIAELAAGPAFLAAIAPRAGQERLWVGAIVLDDRSRVGASERVRADGPELTVPPLAAHQTLVLSAAPTRLEVVDDLVTAGELRDGMVDPLTGERLRWLPPLATPRPQVVGTVEAVALDSGRYHLRLPIDEAADAAIDPDAVRLGSEQPLSVSAMHWEGADGHEATLRWSSSPRVPVPARPEQSLGIAGPGTLVLEFVAPAFGAASLSSVRQIAFGRRDGRVDRYDLVSRASAAASESVSLTDESDQPLRLSPRLLTNFPNPFRDHTRISYDVPATVGEAFDLDAPDAPDLDPTRVMPYASSDPQVTVTIFTLEGHIVAELQAGRQGVGSYEVSWDGRDPSGRTLPSGAYFCKLQIEKWDVTRRLIFVR